MMKTFDGVDCGFAKIKLHDLAKVELIFNDKIEVSEAMVDQVFSWIEANTIDGRGLIINKLHDYCYSFGAQVKLANTELFSCVAIIRADGLIQSPTRHAIESVAKPRQQPAEVKIFAQRDEAMYWINAKLSHFFA